MALGRNKDWTLQTGSGKATFKLCDSAGTPTGSLLTFPYIKDSQITDTTEMTVVKDEGGLVINSIEGSREPKLQMTFMQQDLATIQMMVETYRGQSMQIVKEKNRVTVNGINEYFAFGICKVIPNVTYKGTGGEVQAEWDLLANATTLTVTLADYDDGQFTKTLTCVPEIGVNKYWNGASQT